MSRPPQRNRRTPPGIVASSIGVSIWRIGESAAGGDGVEAGREVPGPSVVVVAERWPEEAARVQKRGMIQLAPQGCRSGQLYRSWWVHLWQVLHRFAEVVDVEGQ